MQLGLSSIPPSSDPRTITGRIPGRKTSSPTRSYDKRTEKAAERDLSGLSLDELRNIRTPEASRERWRRAVDKIIAYNEAAAYSELRWFVNAAAVKQLVGGRGTEIGQYLKERQAELDEHHKKYGLKPGNNHAKTNIRQRVLGEVALSAEEEE